MVTRPSQDGLAAGRGGTQRVQTEGPPALDLRRAVDLGDEGYLHVDAEGLIDDASAGAARVLGDPRRRLVGRSVLEVFVDRGIDRLVGGALGGTAGSQEHVVPGPEPRFVSVRARPDGAGGAWLVVADVTDVRRLRQVRSQFMENLSHELRTPLTTISLLAETLAREADQVMEGLPSRMRDRITRIEIETGHLVQMVAELLDLARIEAGDEMQSDDDVDVGELTASGVERLRLFADRQGVPLTVAVEPGLPPVRGSAARLGQVLANLLHNAIKFSPDGGEVVIRARRTGDHVTVEVEDHGLGIPSADRERVFERFYKVDRARSREAGGTGLGLSIARHIVEAHGGSITVASREGRGSTFTVILPVAVREATAAEVAAGVAAADAAVDEAAAEERRPGPGDAA